MGSTSTSLPSANAATGVRRLASSLAQSYVGLAKKTALACLVAAVFPVVMRVALLGRMPEPLPSIHDEFSYLLGADTFASGRITNPPHPMWQHFESFHILQQPTYASKYPPMQALALAVGQVIGDPWIGVLLSVAAMCGVFCWMMQGWLSPVTALTGALLVGVRVGVFSYWGNSFWGGTVAAIGGALVIGALPRLMEAAKRRDALSMAVGFVILANSRPYEGLFLAVGSIGALLFVCARAGKLGVGKLKALLPLAVVPVVAVLVPAAVAMGYYNFRVTGDWKTLPVTLHDRQYATDSMFLWGSKKAPPVYRHAVMEELWARWDPAFSERARADWGAGFLTRLEFGADFFVGPWWIAIVMILLPHWRGNDTDRRTWPILMFCLLAFVPLKAAQAHYFAPIAGLVYVRFMNAAARLVKWRPTGRAFGPLAAMCAFELVLLQSLFQAPASVGPGAEFARNRNAMESRLRAMPGGQLVIVSYGPRHSPHEEWVYNRADVDRAKVVWARDMGEEKNRELVRYFAGRKVWLLEPDRAGTGLVPY